MATIRKRTLPSGLVRWQVDFTDQAGKRRSKLFPRRKDADVYLVKVRSLVANHTYLADSDSTTVADAAKAWLDHCEVRCKTGRRMEKSNDGLEVEACDTDPVRQRAAMDVDARPGKDLALAIQWKMVCVFGDQHMGDGALGGQAAFDEGCRRGRLRDAVGADATSVFRADGGDLPQLRGHDVETLSPVLADPVHLPAATRAFEAVRFDDLLDARQVRGQVPTVALRRSDLAAGGLIRRNAIIVLRFDLGDRRLQVLEGELPVVLAQLLGLLAMHDMVQFGDEVLEPLDDLLQVGGFCLQGCVRRQQIRMLAQEIGDDITLILGQARQVDLGGSRHAARIP